MKYYLVLTRLSICANHSVQPWREIDGGCDAGDDEDAGGCEGFAQEKGGKWW